MAIRETGSSELHTINRFPLSATQQTWPGDCLVSAHRLRRWPKIKPTLGQRLVFAGKGHMWKIRTLLFEFNRKRRIRQSFRHLDKEGKGYIGVSEACGVLQKMLGFSVEKSENKIKELDKNHDDKLDYEEFVALYATVEDEWVFSDGCCSYSYS